VKIETRVITEVIAAVALSGVLHLITLYQLPEGGRITAAAMVPVLFVAVRRGPRIGILAGLALGLVVLVEEPFIYHPVQVLLDYPMAYGALGLAGFFRKLPVAGVVVGIAGRFVCHFTSGLVFFATYAPAGMSPALYSAVYNASYLVPELIVSAIVMFVLQRRRIIQLYL
jgi:thiamine transporter